MFKIFERFFKEDNIQIARRDFKSDLESMQLFTQDITQKHVSNVDTSKRYFPLIGERCSDCRFKIVRKDNGEDACAIRGCLYGYKW